jgi:hypothetical protein
MNCGIEEIVQLNILLLRLFCVKSRPRDNKNVIKSGTVAGRSAIPWLSTISVQSDLERLFRHFQAGIRLHGNIERYGYERRKHFGAEGNRRYNNTARG